MASPDVASHQLAGAALARFVLVMGARTFALIQAIHATDDRSPARMRQLYAAHGATLLI